MRKFLNLVIVIMCATVSVSAQALGQASAQTGAQAQARQDRKQYFEAKSVALKIDAPATQPANEDAYPRISFSYPAEDFKPGVVKVGLRTTYLKEGLRTDEVVRLLGKPSSVSERSENDVVVTIYQFPRGEGRILVAEFVNGVLVRSRIETRAEQDMQADR